MAEAPIRKIIHIDMDAFFASIEQRDNETYRGKPLAVGYPGKRGVVAAASYEARRYGVKSAMASVVALRRCPHLIFAAPRFDVYKEVSNQIMDIFYEYTDLVEPLSLDEAFLDVTQNKKNMQVATTIAMEIKNKIFQKTGLTASAGVSYNKFLAKIASDQNKPNGIFIIRPRDAESFVEKLEIGRFFGVGRVTAERMDYLGIKTGWDLKQKSEQDLIALFGKMGSLFYRQARGLDERPVESHHIRKSIGAETTFDFDIDSYDDLARELESVARDVMQRMGNKDFEGRTLTLKIKYADFKLISKSKTFLLPVKDYDQLITAGLELLSQVDITPKVRLIGLSVKNSGIKERWSDALQLEIDFDYGDRESTSI